MQPGVAVSKEVHLHIRQLQKRGSNGSDVMCNTGNETTKLKKMGKVYNILPSLFLI